MTKTATTKLSYPTKTATTKLSYHDTCAAYAWCAEFAKTATTFEEAVEKVVLFVPGSESIARKGLESYWNEPGYVYARKILAEQRAA